MKLSILHRIRTRSRRRGSALVTTFLVMAILAVSAVVYVDYATQTMRESRRSTDDVLTTNLTEAGVQAELRALWRIFKEDQTFEEFDDLLVGASKTAPKGIVANQIGPRNGRYAAAVITYVNSDAYTRLITIRSLGWLDRDNDGVLDNGEPRKLVDVATTFSLLPSRVFDYTYFVNNYGWMYGFNQNTLIVNGDMRANGNFDFQGGSPTVNGRVVGAPNSKLDPAASGIINSAPVKQTDASYLTSYNGTAGMTTRWRQPYNPAIHGAIGSAEFENWRDLVFESDAQAVNGRPFGATLSDVNGTQAWSRTSPSSTITKTMIDSESTKELVMPDLRDLNRYISLSQNYVDNKATFSDGSTNPNYGQGAKLEVWDSSQGRYVRVDTNGVVNGSAVLIGTDAHPIRITGPVTVTQDAVLKGTVQGQGTIYTGRNVHVVGSLVYKNPPNFKGSNPATVEATVEKADMLGLAARGSVLFGNPNSYGATYPLYYMTPPFTKGRYDENGNYIPPFNANQVDSTGRKLYQSVISDSVMNSIAEGVNQVDAIMYTNNLGGGQVGTGGSGLTINGSLISKDEAMVVYSLPLRLNYDNRIRERKATSQPLIDLQLPRAPTLIRNSWQEWGFGNTTNLSPAFTGGNGTFAPAGPGNGTGNGQGNGWGFFNNLLDALLNLFGNLNH
ncbi:MAG: hypothetical protein MH204_12645 [Fimbriimonadaceae bacterium]|nr:hypothetical protein [Fimbriimonadaceae bacterium]